MPESLTREEIKALADKWYKLLDVHAPITEFLPLLHETELEMRFPEATLKGQGAFSEWLAGVVRIFFDEVHTLKKVEVDIQSHDTAQARVVVNWKARRWKAPAPNAENLDFDAYQTWVVKRSPVSGQAVIATYIVDKLEPQPGSVAL